MLNETQAAEDVTILVQFPERPGVQRVNLLTVSR
jgi:hypothetical protein